MLLDRLAEYRDAANVATQQREAAKELLRRNRVALRKSRRLVKATEEALAIAQTVASAVQTRAYQQIASVVSRCLSAVFDEPYELQMQFVQRRGRTEVDLLFRRGGLLVDPMTASGGGVIDVASFALRLAAIVLAKPPLRRLLVLDEPFRFVSAEYRPRVRALLSTLAEEMGVQFVLVTHIDELRSGTIIELE